MAGRCVRAPTPDDRQDAASLDRRQPVRRVPLVVVLVLLALPPPHAGAEARRPLAVDDLFALQQVGVPRISPEGTWVAYALVSIDRKKDTSNTHVYMVPIAGGA